MNFSDIPFNPDRKVLRQFAVLWVLFFVTIGTYQFFAHARGGVGLGLIIAGLTIGIPGLLWPHLLRWIFVTWMVLVSPIGWLVFTLVMLALYYLLITPLAIFFRLKGRDWLRKNPAPHQKTFWEPKGNPLDPLSYYRQY
jgi:hypothetical protein